MSIEVTDGANLQIRLKNNRAYPQSNIEYFVEEPRDSIEFRKVQATKEASLIIPHLHHEYPHMELLGSEKEPDNLSIEGSL